MIGNAIVYGIQPGVELSFDAIQQGLAQCVFAPCSGSQEMSSGFCPVRDEENGALVENVGGQWIIKVAIEKRTVPGDAIKRGLQQRLEEIEASTGRKVGKKEKREIKEDVRAQLLPSAFPKLTKTTVWIDPTAKKLIIGATAASKADEVATLLVKFIDGIALAPIRTENSPSEAMTQWLLGNQDPENMSMDRQCELRTMDEAKSNIKYKGVPLDAGDIRDRIEQGYRPVNMSLTWNDRVSFMLTDSLHLKKIKFLEGTSDAVGKTQGVENDEFDANVAIATGELQPLIKDLIANLGGQSQI